MHEQEASKNLAQGTLADTGNAIGVLRRREIEARIVGPLLDALGAEFGREAVLEVARATIVRIAREQGAQLATQVGRNDLGAFEQTLDAWTQDDALRIEVVERDAQRFGFNVTRCRYAELYQALGIPELGAVLSCNRDYALIEGFNPGVELTRTQTIMQGASHCDFRYRLAEAAAGEPERP
ncbi:L-2-amino-thiazoline-4-carboxylic acid hydrolase [Candidatus Chloroploca sp. M-50]|uniref:L-2-amino-thiazoline-4-carboxylic acid hydrolase n=1 Tax=Candidatus Chloroploca mongolica TaxID=2528176 RepID=A0ABS4DEC8_9CHLR|nr:L-2-amino-thiazoline-4-carboxylic acid hydrolase [Candidatus Chloroploca mongolica]MBP1467699.1 L-2-amino-thiazoline-4-carboxylic acid hydrolase [Candidatus Chloroploca mongolica]